MNFILMSDKISNLILSQKLKFQINLKVDSCLWVNKMIKNFRLVADSLIFWCSLFFCLLQAHVVACKTVSLVPVSSQKGDSTYLCGSHWGTMTWAWTRGPPILQQATDQQAETEEVGEGLPAMWIIQYIINICKVISIYLLVHIKYQCSTLIVTK